MEALFKLKKGTTELHYVTDAPEPAPGPEDIKVRIHACGICGTDLHIRQDHYLVYPPVILGHEYSGVVEAVGSQVTDFLPGDRVVSLTAAQTCGTCAFCLQDLRMLCAERRCIGSGVNGCFATYMCIPAALAFHVPETVPLDVAALCEPLACAVRAVMERTVLCGGDRVLVSGAGLIGQLVAQVARACGGTVVMTGLSADAARLKLALQLGVSAVADVQNGELEAVAARVTGGQGFDVAFECSGAASSAENCLKFLRKTGRYTQVGLYGRPVLFDHDLALTKELVISNSFASERTSWQRALRLLEAGKLDIQPLIGRKLPLRDWEEGFSRFARKEDMKVLLCPGQSA